MADSPFHVKPKMRSGRRSLLLAALFIFALNATALAQRVGVDISNGPHTLFGDIKAEGLDAAGTKAPSFEVVLYTLSGGVISRQTVPNNGRYRFMDLNNGHYVVAVSVENQEVARVRVHVESLYKTDFRQDIELEAKSDAKGGRAQTVSAADSYTRTPANQSLFDKAQAAMDGKKLDDGVALLVQLVAADPKDFQAWTELGTARLLQKNEAEAEKAYRRALEERPTFFLALLNLGRLLIAQKKYDAGLEPLTKAVEAQPTSADANHLLGETYLQLKKGSMAVGYLNEALKHDPQGKADVHLRLAALYNAAGMKDRAAAEYEQFLSKKPDHPDKKKLQQYISENKKQ
jgi:tetratricopeptide (TPR) repeat protein